MEESFTGGDKEEAEKEGSEEKEEIPAAERGDSRRKVGIQEVQAERKRLRKENDRKERATKRVRHTLRNFKAPSSLSSYSSSSSSDSNSDSDVSSQREQSRERREQRFTNILGEMIRKTGEIVVQQVISNAELINKLQNTEDELRKEVAELKQEKREQEQRRQNEKKEVREPVHGKREIRLKDVKEQGKEKIKAKDAGKQGKEIPQMSRGRRKGRKLREAVERIRSIGGEQTMDLSHIEGTLMIMDGSATDGGTDTRLRTLLLIWARNKP